MSKLLSFTFSFVTMTTLILFFNANLAMASDEPPISLPTGKHIFQGGLLKKFLRHSKNFNHNNKEDAIAIKDLKNKGYFCMRRSTVQTVCQLKETSFELPARTSELVAAKLKDYPIIFPESPEVEFSHHGSTTKEWMIHGPFYIGEKKLNVYRITQTYEGEIFIAFPVDEENPISFLTYHESLGLGFTMVLQSTDTDGWKNAYYFEALYKPDSL